ncbi:MAG: LuxR C-terminal-related transcriptional regulator [Aggregatilineales bacterium]
MDDLRQQSAFQQSLEAERRAMARALQETVINQLNLLLSQASVYDQTLRNPDARMAVSILSSLARQALQQALDLENNLHPTILDSLGLESALDAFALQMKRSYGIYIALMIDRLRTRLPAQIELVLFRTTQEIVEYAQKQAQATRFTITLHKRDGLLTYLIEHDGNPSIDMSKITVNPYIESLSGKLSRTPNAQGQTGIQIEFSLIDPIDMTEREMEVLICLTEGMTNKEIALKLDISPRTVKFHLDNIYSKLGVSTRTEAAVYALNHNWQKPS